MSAPTQHSMQQLEQISLKKLPPYNVEAERAVLSAILLDKEALYRAEAVMSGSDCYRKPHQQIFAAAKHLIETEEALDLVLLRDELLRRKELETVGGPAFLASLVDQVPSAANVEYHAKVVHEKAILRRLLNASIETATRCYDGMEEAETLLNAAEQQIFDIAAAQDTQPVQHITTGLITALDRIEACYHGEPQEFGLQTGFPDLDRMLIGLLPGDVVVIGARPEMGKTSLAGNILAYNSVKRQVPTAMFEAEMTQEEFAERVLCAEARVNMHRVRLWDFAPDEAHEAYDRLEAAANTLHQAPLYIDDTPNIGIVELRAKTRRLIREKHIKLVVIDHLTLLKPPQRRDKRHLEIDDCMQILKAMAKSLHIPVIVLCQLNRNLESRSDKRPQLADLRESGSIEEYADKILFIYREEVYHPTTDENNGKAEILVRKHRNGPMGDVALFFNKPIMRFENLATEEGGPF